MHRFSLFPLLFVFVFGSTLLTDAEGLAVARKLYSGYGEAAPEGTGPDQDQIAKQGSAYLKKFSKLDYLRSAVIQ